MYFLGAKFRTLTLWSTACSGATRTELVFSHRVGLLFFVHLSMQATPLRVADWLDSFSLGHSWWFFQVWFWHWWQVLISWHYCFQVSEAININQVLKDTKLIRLHESIIDFSPTHGPTGRGLPRNHERSDGHNILRDMNCRLPTFIFGFAPLSGWPANQISYDFFFLRGDHKKNLYMVTIAGIPNK